MKNSLLLFITIITILFTACQKTPEKNWMAQALDISSNQLMRVADEEVPTNALFPGSLWYAYEVTGDERLKAQAIRYTNLLNPMQGVKDPRDLEFMICSYANALRLSPNDTIEAVLVKAADTLCTRLNSESSCICCGNILDLLFSASKLTGNKKYYDTAVKYAQTTLKHNSRFNDTCHQDINGSSETSKQAWIVYNYTDCYRETQDIAFLQEAMQIADTIIKQVKTAEYIADKNGNAPDSKESPHDATTAGITASALLELSTLAPDGLKYFKYAEIILKILSQPDYLEADYYYLEALKRYLDMLK